MKNDLDHDKETKMFPNMQSTEQIIKETWNAAIEEAAKIAERSETNLTKLIAEDIKGLKK